MSDRLDIEHDFAPLTPDEMAAHGPEQARSEEALTLVVPVPWNAPRVTFRHRDHGTASETWCYPDENGEPLGYVARFDLADGSKQILPRTLWRGERDLFWKWKQWQEPRPLYGLDRLAQNPSESVVVVEGEKCADAAVPVFPQSVVITSPGGSKAAGKVDWSPLKGRRVLIWPDADEAGDAYAQAVALHATRAGAAEILIVDAAALCSKGPGVEARETPDGWDVADALMKDGWEPAQLRKTAYDAARPYEAPAAPLTWPFGFTLDSKGLWHDPGGEKQPVSLSGPFAVLGLARDASGDGWAIALEWRDRDGIQHRHFIPKADLIGDGTDVLRPLVSGGLEVSPNTDRLKKFKAALFGVDCASRVRLVKRSGWHGDVFVLPHATLGNSAGERIVYDGRPDAARYVERGSLGEWVEQVAAPAAGNSRLVFALSTAFAGPLADLLSDEGGGVHLVGGSSLGKSTALVVAGSVWGGGGRGGFTQTWRATGNALEAIARAHSGTLLALDELGELDAKEAGSTAYLLVNGQGKGRGTRDGDARVRSEWRVMLLSSGEVGLGEKIAETGKRAKAGQLIRLVDIPADAGKGSGLFEDTKGENPADFSKRIKAAALEFYGTAGPAFVARLAEDTEAVASLARDRIAEIQRDLLAGIGETGGQAWRVAYRFALIATAGELAADALGLPWGHDEPSRAASLCFDGWRSTLGGDGPGELVAAMDAIKAAVEKHGESRFRTLHDTAQLQPGSNLVVRDLIGYRFTRDGEMVWGFTATGWREVLAGIAGPSTITNMLAERGALLTGSDPAHRLGVKVDNRTVMVVAVKASALDQRGVL